MNELGLTEVRDANAFMLTIVRKAIAAGSTRQQAVDVGRTAGQELTPEEIGAAWIDALFDIAELESQREDAHNEITDLKAALSEAHKDLGEDPCSCGYCDDEREIITVKDIGEVGA